MFGIKTHLKNSARNKALIAVKRSSARLSETHGMNKYFMLFGAWLNLKEEAPAYQLNSPIAPYINPVARAVRLFLSQFNPNNLGNWLNTQPYNLSTHAEASAIEWYKKRISAPLNNTGYFTSGATEGNIFCAWSGKEYLKKQGISLQKMALLRTDLTHYSVKKAAKITELQEVVIPINLDSWALDEASLETVLQREHRRGIRGFLLALTAGHTVGGTDDPIADVQKLIEQFKKKYPKAHFFVWIDAAYSGVSKLFLEKKWRPLHGNNTKALVVDFHKTLGVSYPAGLVLHQSQLSSLIESNPSYITHKDQTLLGSRSGMAPLETHFTFQFYGLEKLKKIFMSALSRKNTMLSQIPEDKGWKIVTHPTSLQAAIVSLKPLPLSLFKHFKLKQNKETLLTTKGKKTVFYSKLYFFPKY